MFLYIQYFSILLGLTKTTLSVHIHHFKMIWPSFFITKYSWLLLLKIDFPKKKKKKETTDD